MVIRLRVNLNCISCDTTRYNVVYPIATVKLQGCTLQVYNYDISRRLYWYCVHFEIPFGKQNRGVSLILFGKSTEFILGRMTPYLLFCEF